MEFRAPFIAAQQNVDAIAYLTKNLTDAAAGRQMLEGLLNRLGNAVDSYPGWHPIMKAPQQSSANQKSSLSSLSVYKGLDHTIFFVRGFVTCPYSENIADQLMDAVNKVPQLHAYRLQEPLYADNAYPVVIEAREVELEADGTIRSRDVLAWFTQQLAENAKRAEVAETWWNIRSNILGSPHGSRSSLFVNQYTGRHMRKILDAMNDSGMFGPIKEESLEMLSNKKRETISETLLRTAVTNWDRSCERFEFELRGETCKAAMRDTWEDGMELSIRVKIGDDDLYASGFYYADGDRMTDHNVRGKRALAEKFL
jgi:hypothetical protein